MNHFDYQTVGGYLKVTDIMSRNVILVNEEDSIRDVMGIFEQWQISGAPVVNRLGEYISVISKTDLLDKAVQSNLKGFVELSQMKVKDVIKTRHIWTVTEETSVAEAADLMLNSRIHRVFVKNKQGRIHGVVSTFDIMKVFSHIGASYMPQHT